MEPANVLLTDDYRARTPESARFYAESAEQAPGGVHGNIKYYAPYPLTFQRAQGPRMWDVDGHAYVDYLLGFGTLILGHGHPAIRKAIQRVWEEAGTSVFGVPSPWEGMFAERIRALYPSMELLRYTNSGLEATLLAVRLALAYTGRATVAKFGGHYHGAHEQVLFNSQPTRADGGTDGRPAPSSYGLPQHFIDHALILPFNDWAACEALLIAHADDVGAVILEPLLGGVVPAERRFLENLRLLTRRLGVPLIFDEVKTGCRVSLGGAQGWYQIAPDLTCLGKVIGGGLPIGLVGGRRDLLDMCSPLRSAVEGGPVFHSGTFNGNPLSLSAGLAALDILEQPGVFDGLVAHAARLRSGVVRAGAAAGFQIQTQGIGTVFDIFFTSAPPHDSRSWAGTDLELRQTFDFLAMRRGVFTKPQHRISVSVAHDEETAQATLAAWEQALQELRGACGGHVPGA